MPRPCRGPSRSVLFKSLSRWGEDTTALRRGPSRSLLLKSLSGWGEDATALRRGVSRSLLLKSLSGWGEDATALRRGASLHVFDMQINEMKLSRRRKIRAFPTSF
jgi:hypothetical protein